MTTTIQVQQFRFNDGAYRNVEVPTAEISENIDETLEKVFMYGQNDFQPLDRPSVSVGDVINYDGQYFVVANFGFKKIKSDMYATLQNACRASIKNMTRYELELWNAIGEESLKYC